MSGFISRPNSRVGLNEIVASRHLIFQLIKRDFFVRYKQTFLGFLWALINPAVNTLLFLFVFGLLVRIPTPEYSVPYAAVLVVGILFWNLFSSSMTAASDALLFNIHLIKKVYFARISLCIASAASAVIDFLIAIVVFVPISLLFGIDLLSWRILAIIPITILLIMLGYGLGCIMAILKVKYKDIRHLQPLLMQCLFYASPIVYTVSLVPDRYLPLFQLNPLVGVIELARWALLNGSSLNLSVLFYSMSVAIFMIVFGIWFFLAKERDVVDSE